MPDLEALKTQIRTAFADAKYPGDESLRGSDDGDEPYLLEREFIGQTDWRLLDPKMIDRAPDGYGSALSFFSDEAFRFYLPAYLLADLDGLLQQHNPTFHLTHGLTNGGKQEFVNPRRYGNRTWFAEASNRLAAFDRKQAAAVVAYLRYQREIDDFSRNEIDEALANFWLAKAGETKD